MLTSTFKFTPQALAVQQFLVSNASTLKYVILGALKFRCRGSTRLEV